MLYRFWYSMMGGGGGGDRCLVSLARERSGRRLDMYVDIISAAIGDTQMQFLSCAASLFPYVKGVSHRNYVELRSVAYQLRRAYSALRCAHAGLRGNRPRDAKGYARWTQKINKFSTQFLSKSTLLYAVPTQ